MEYSFTFDALNRPSAKCSMEHEAFGDWLTHDLNSNQTAISQLLTKLEALRDQHVRQFQFSGRDYHLTLTQEDAILQAAAIHGDGEYVDTFEQTPDLLFDEQQAFAIDTDELSLDDQHGQAMCGLEDFHELLIAWQAFIESGAE